MPWAQPQLSKVPNLGGTDDGRTGTANCGGIFESLDVFYRVCQLRNATLSRYDSQAHFLNPAARTVRSDGPSVRTVRTDHPYGPSVRTVRTDGPYGPSVRTVRFLRFGSIARSGSPGSVFCAVTRSADSPWRFQRFPVRLSRILKPE